MEKNRGSQQPFKCHPPSKPPKRRGAIQPGGGNPFPWLKTIWLDGFPGPIWPSPKTSPTRNKHKGISQKYANMSFDRNKTKRTSYAQNMQVQKIFLLLQRVAPNGCNGAGNKRCLDLSAANLLRTCPGMSQFYLCTLKTNKIQLIWEL